MEKRLEKSIGTLEAARNDLNQLICTAKLRDVRRALNSARGTLYATRYLDRDLRNANDAARLANLVGAQQNLEQTISLTTKRFLLDKDDYE